MLVEKKILDKIEIVNEKNIQVREAVLIEKNEQIIAKTFHRYILSPGDDLSEQPQKIKDIAEILWK
jgi:hypothetical protein